MNHLIRAAHEIALAKSYVLEHRLEDQAPPGQVKSICEDIIRLMDVAISLADERDPNSPDPTRALVMRLAGIVDDQPTPLPVDRDDAMGKTPPKRRSSNGVSWIG